MVTSIVSTAGWVAESDGRFDFTYFVYVPGTDDDGNPILVPVARNANYPIHPGIVHGLFQIRNIRETTEVEPFHGNRCRSRRVITIVDINGQEVENIDRRNLPIVYDLQPVFFDADIEIENPVSGFVTKEASGAGTETRALETHPRFRAARAARHAAHGRSFQGSARPPGREHWRAD